MKLKVSLIVALVVLVVAFGVVWEQFPIVRYWLSPVTGSTAAPASFYTDNIAKPSKATEQAGQKRVLADQNGVVQDIDQVPVEGGWINSQPLDLKQLQKENKVVLIDFWTYTCINCIRADPYTQQLWERYKDHGLVVIGVHSPEFDIEKSPANILAAIKQAGLTYPVLTDGNMAVWRSFGNHTWPAKYLIDTQGDIVFHQFGEGDYAGEEDAVREQLTKAGYNLPDLGPPNPKMHLLPARRAQTSELYAGPGFVREPYGNNHQPEIGKPTHFTLPKAALDADKIYLGGNWQGQNDYVESQDTGVIALNYQAQAPYIVLDTADGDLTVAVTLDGQPLPKDLRGEDIELENGQTVMHVNAPRLYYPVAHQAAYARRTIRFQVPAGIRLYSFTFGTYQ